MAFRALILDGAAKKRIEVAAAFEKKLRLEAFLEVKQDIIGFELRQITVRDLLKLEFTENRLITGGEPQLDDLVQLVFMLSVDGVRFKKRHAKKIAKALRYSEFARDEVQSFFFSAYNDMPACGSSSKSVEDIDSSVSIASLVDSLAATYSWSLRDILDMPMSTALQLLQRIVKNRLGDKYSMRNRITQQAKSLELNKLKNNG
jgi:organic radical activating enzyme